MILLDYINNYKITFLKQEKYIGKLVELNYFGHIININDYIFNKQKINFLQNNKYVHNEFWYFLQGPYDLYITLRLFKYDLSNNFIYQLFLINELNIINELDKRIGMWISNIDYSLLNIYNYDLYNLYIHNRLFSLILSNNIQEKLFYESKYENFLIFVQQLNCTLQLYINQYQFDIIDTSIQLENSFITAGKIKIGELINIENNNKINIYQYNIIQLWLNVKSFKGFYYHNNNFYLIYINNIYYLCKFIENNIYFICQFNDLEINLSWYINLQLNFSILTEKINKNEYNYLKKNIYNFHNKINQYISKKGNS